MYTPKYQDYVNFVPSLKEITYWMHADKLWDCDVDPLAHAAGALHKQRVDDFWAFLTSREK